MGKDQLEHSPGQRQYLRCLCKIEKRDLSVQPVDEVESPKPSVKESSASPFTDESDSTTPVHILAATCERGGVRELVLKWTTLEESEVP